MQRQILPVTKRFQPREKVASKANWIFGSGSIIELLEEEKEVEAGSIRTRIILSLSLSVSRGAIKNLITNRIDNTRRLRANEFPRNSLYPLTFPVRNINSFRSSKLHRLSTRPFPPPPRHFNYKLSRPDRGGPPRG